MACQDFLTYLGFKRSQGPDLQTTSLLLLVVLLLGAVSGVTNLALEPRVTFFVEGDPSLSYPYIEDSAVSVPTTVLLLISFGIPIIAFILCHIVLHSCECFCVGKRVHKRLLVTLLWFGVCCMAAVSVTSVLKFYEGRLRPDFYAMCNYKGYRTVLQACEHSSDWSACASQYPSYSITLGAPGSISHCLDREHLSESQSSYPSGHSSVAMSGLGFLAYFLYYFCDGADLLSALLRILLPATSVCAAIMIAATRPHDYWHNYSDINFGMSIGAACAVFCGRMWKSQMVQKEREGLPQTSTQAAIGSQRKDSIPSPDSIVISLN